MVCVFPRPCFSARIGLDLAQKERSWYDDIEQYFRSGSYCKDATVAEKRAIRRECGTVFALKGDTLVYSTCSKRSPRKEDDDRVWCRVIKYKDERQEVMKQCHTQPTGGHFGRDKTLEKVQSRFFGRLVVSAFVVCFFLFVHA